MNDSFKDFDRIFRHMEEMINASQQHQNNDQRNFVRRVDDLIIYDKRKKLSFTLDLKPVKNKEDIFISVTKNTLALTVLLKGQQGHDELKLPVTVKPKTVKTTFINGILDIEIDIETP